MVNPSKFSKFKSEREELGTTLFHTSTEIGDYLRDKSHTLNWNENRMLTNLVHKIRIVRSVIDDGKTFKKIMKDIYEEKNPGSTDELKERGRVYKAIDRIDMFRILEQLYEIYNDNEVKEWRNNQAEGYIRKIIESNRVDNKDKINLFIDRYRKFKWGF